MENPTQQSVYEIPEANRAWLEAKIGKLNARARRTGCKAIEMVWEPGRVELQLRNRDTKLNRWIDVNEIEKFEKDHSNYRRTGLARNLLNLTITGETPKYAGWTFCGTLEPVDLEGGTTENLLMCVPGQSIPHEFAHHVGYCDHCHTKRYRRQTFVVRDENGIFKAVGRQCVAEFLGGAQPENIASMATWLCEVESACRAATNGSFGTHHYAWDLETFLAWTTSCIEKDGWVSRAMANECAKASTSSAVMSCLTPNPNETRDEKMWRMEREPQQAHFEMATAAVDWLQNLSEKDLENDYLRNIHLVMRTGTVQPKTAGLAASIISAYNRAAQAEIAKKQQPTGINDYFGKEGDKVELNVTVVGVHSIASEYGATGIHNMRSPDGYTFVWFATGSNWLESGESYKIKATVKGHSVWQGNKQTILQRVRVVEEKT